MSNNIFQIQTHLKKYKAYCACERDLEMLNDEERHIIQLHLIDGKSWKRIEAEYEQKDEYEYRATRTLMRYQQQALKKIEEYVCNMVA